MQSLKLPSCSPARSPPRLLKLIGRGSEIELIGRVFFFLSRSRRKRKIYEVNYFGLGHLRPGSLFGVPALLAPSVMPLKGAFLCFH